MMLTIMPVCKLYIMVVNISGHPYFLGKISQSNGVEFLCEVNNDKIDLALCTIPGVVTGSRSSPLCSGSNESGHHVSGSNTGVM